MIDLELFVSMILGILDLIMLYYAYCGLANTKCSFTTRNILIGFWGGCISGAAMHYFESEHSRIFFYIFIIIAIHTAYRKKIYNAVIVFASMYLIIMPVQLTVGLILFPFSIKSEIVLYLTAQSLSLAIIVFLYKKVSIYRLLYKIEKELLITLFFLVLNCIVYIIFFLTSFEFTKPYYMLYLLIVLISMYGIYKTASKIYFYTNKLPLIKHDMGNALIGLRILVNHSKDLYEINNNVNECFRVLGMDTEIPCINTQEENNMFYEFIKYKDHSKSNWKKLRYDIDIQYQEQHSEISETVAMIMLGILLDNAIESSGSGKSIKISLLIDEGYLLIIVTSQYNHGLYNEYLDIVNHKQHDNKKHGYGLYKLNEIVSNYNGRLDIETSNINRSKHIIMRIEIK